MTGNIAQLPPGSRVLVTGATGFTGSVLVRKLAAAGHFVRAIARTSSRTDALAGVPVEWVRGDVADPSVAAAAMPGMHYVVHMATAYREGGAGEDVFRRVHVVSTEHLARAAAKEPGFRRFVHISTMGVHGHIDGPPADEDAPFAPGDAYQSTKVEAEEWLRGFAPGAGLSFTILRPCAIMGPGDRRLLKLFKMAARGVMVLIGGGRCLYHLVHVEDLTDAMLLAAAHPAAEKEAFLCGNTEAIGLAEIGGIVAGALGRRLRVIRLPAGPFFAAAAACEAVCRPLGIAPPLYKRRVAFFTKDRSFDTSKIRRVLGFAPAFDNRAGILDALAGYVRQGWIAAPPGGLRGQ